MDWPKWTLRADERLRAGAAAMKRRYDAKSAWEGVPVCSCRLCETGKLREAHRYPMNGRAVVAGYLARFAAVLSALGAVPLALVGGVGHWTLAALVIVSAWGFAAPLYVLGVWCTSARPGLACDHCRAWTEAL